VVSIYVVMIGLICEGGGFILCNHDRFYLGRGWFLFMKSFRFEQNVFTLLVTALDRLPIVYALALQPFLDLDLGQGV
jgi:hypothetical protein